MAKKSGKRVTSAGGQTRRGSTPVEAPLGGTPSLVVGLGASAGGLAPLQALLSRLPIGRGLAVVVVQPVPTRSDVYPLPLIAEKTKLQVVEAVDESPILGEHVYVMPPGKSLSIVGGKLSVKDVAQCHGLRMPIDHFLCTLAADQGRRAAGVVLSGAGRDGADGLAEIKAQGGVTAAQDPGTARHQEMPQHAISAGHADAVLPPEQLAAFLIKRADEIAALTAEEEQEAGLQAILAAVHVATGHDFRCYKRGTLERRIRRRLGLHQLASYDEYARMLRTDKDQAAALRQDLMIGVTDFFRQGEAWRVLEEKVIAALVASAQPQSTLRVWVPACATGKEAYSLAMLLAENIQRSGKKLSLQVFATDADVSALDVARAGQYGEEDLKGVSQARLRRFFVRRSGRYEIVKGIRESIVFAPQDLLSDPPFSKLDLVSCRNLLIYLDPAVQKKIIQLFHFALRDGGYLFMGSAETIGGQENLFAPVAQKWRIYRKLAVATPLSLDLPLRPQGKPAMTIPPAGSQRRPTLPSITLQAIAERYGPAAALVDRKGALLYTHGNVRDFLEIPIGEHTGLLSDAAREGLRNRLNGAIANAVSENRKVTVHARVRKDKKSVPVEVTVSPLRHPQEADGLLLVTFEEQRLPKAQPTARSEPAHSDARQLEDELKLTREELQSTIGQLEQTNEHLKASNEEVTAANEELQSANEELETSKEELQSVNEELNTVNQRLQEKVGELEQASNDISNLLTSGSIATVFLDRDLKVRRFTQAVTKFLSLVESDIGRPISDIHCKFRDEPLLNDARRVLGNLMPAMAEVQAEDGDWYLRRILPYRTKDDRIEGVVITFSNVTELKELTDALRDSEQAVRQSESRYRELVQNANSAIIRWKRDGTVTFFNEYAQSFFGYSAEEVIGKHVGLLVPQQDSAGGDLTTLLQDIVASPEKYVNNVNENICRDGRRVWMAWTNKAIHDESGQVEEVLAVGSDITERKGAQEEARQLATFPAQNPNPVLRVAAEGNLLYANAAAREMLEAMGSAEDRPMPQPVMDLVAEANRADHVVEAELADRCGRVFMFDAARPAGQRYVNLYARNITARRRAEEALREGERQNRFLADLLERSSQPFGVGYPDGRLGIVNGAFERLTGYGQEELRTLDWAKVLTPSKWRDLERSKLEELHRTGKPVRYEKEYLRKDGTLVPIELLVHMVTDEQGQPRHYYSFLTDLTERKRAEEALKDSEERHRLLAETMLQGVVHQDANGTVISMNPAAERILGTSRDQFLGSSSVREEDHTIRENGEPFPGMEHPAMVALRTGQQVRGVIMGVFNPKVRDFRWISIDAVPVCRPGESRIAEVYTIFEDITERKRAEDAVRRHTATLEAVNGVLAAALTCQTEEDLGVACLEIAQRLTQSKFGFIGEINEKLLQDIAISNPGWDACAIIDASGHRRSAGSFKIHGIYGRVLSDGKSLFTNDPANHPDGIGLPAGHPPLEAFLGVPLVREGRTIGMIAVANRPGGYTAVEQETLDVLAPAIVEAFMRKRADEELRDARTSLEVRVKERTAELEQAIVALRQSEFRYRTLFETMDQGFCVVEMIDDPQGKPVDYRFVEINPMFEKHTGLQNALGRTIRELVPNHDAHWFEVYGRVARTGEACRFEDAATAMQRFYDVFAFRIGEAENPRVGILFTDITDKRRTEAALREAYETLEHRVAERTVELARSNEDLEQFAYIASHDLQEPLRMVTGFLNLLKERYRAQLDDKAREYIGYSVDGATRMSSLIRDLLEYSRLDRKERLAEPVDANHAVAEALANLRSRIDAAGATVTHDELPTVSGDQVQLTQVFQNLISNAVKFRSPDQPCHVHIAAERRDRQWIFSVRDNGIGIAPKHRDRIFVIFQRLHGPGTYPGTGIGLALCKRIVERHGGRIWVESTAGEGATFYFALPETRAA